MAATPKTTTDMTKFASVGRNVRAMIEGDILFIAIDTKAEGQRSASGKTVVKASTLGNQAVPGLEAIGAKLGLNFYIPAPAV